MSLRHKIRLFYFPIQKYHCFFIIRRNAGNHIPPTTISFPDTLHTVRPGYAFRRQFTASRSGDKMHSVEPFSPSQSII